MKRPRPCTVELDDDDEEDEFTPLFDYSETVGPPPTFLSDDSDDEDIIIASGPPQIRPKLSPVKEPATPKDQAPIVSVVDDDDDDDDDRYSWLNSTPAKSPYQPPPGESPYLDLAGNHALQQLRNRRMELMMLQHRASPESMRRVEEQAIKRAGEQSRMQAQMRGEAEPSVVVKTPVGSNFPGTMPPGSEATASDQRAKILMKVQNSTGSVQSIRIYMTDKFEKLFRVYAETAKVPLANLRFRFDGDQLSPTSTPKDHDMEDGELIEVYHSS